MNQDLPLRLTRSEVCALARISDDTLARRIKAGQMPGPVERGRQSLFDRAMVLRALEQPPEPTEAPRHDRPSKRPGLGKYVIAQQRVDGTYRVHFFVPPRVRPENWPASIPLPLNGRRGDLTDPEVVMDIRRDATKLLKRFRAARKSSRRSPH